jgi:LacI family transcriptional regulator
MSGKNRNQSARSLKVALLIESSRIYGRGVLRGIAKYAHVHEQWSFFTEERELHSGVPGWLKNWKGHGIIARIEDRKMATALAKTGLPIVDVLGNARFPNISTFDTDAKAVAKLAADFFLKAGFQHFGFCGYQKIPFSERREAAYSAYLAEKGKKALTFALPLPKGLHSHIQAIERRGLSMELAIAKWLKDKPRPLALFACNDVLAQQVLNACRESDIKVPEEVAIMGVDNDDVLCSLCEPALTSIEPNVEQLGYQAAGLLNQMMRGKRSTNELTLIPPVRIVERASTDIVAIDDSIIVQAVRFIRDHVGSGIAVKDVLSHVNRSRTDIEKRFLHWMGCSVHSEILRLRMERVRELLRLTDLNLEQIAARTGFATSAHLCRLFQRNFRQTPTDYRKSIAV